MSSPVVSAAERLEHLYQQSVSHYSKSRKRLHTWLRLRAPDLLQIKQASQQMAAAVSLAGSVALNQPQLSPIQLPVDISNSITAVNELVFQKAQATASGQEAPFIAQVTQEEHQAILTKMEEFVRQVPGHLPQQDEQYLEQQLSDMLGFDVTAELDGNRLNHSIGIMGGEQHLKRFPTDTLAQHDAYQESGIAPNRGAFGWFTEQGELTEKAIQREKYYVAVQTLYLPNWNTDHPKLKEWYKFRKMVVINPVDQKAMVVVVGDAGPALWVKKQFGGSPEVIREGQIWSKEARGRVMLLFVDDPEDKVALGPISLDWNTYSATAASTAAQLKTAK